MTDKQEQRWREAEAEWVERYERLEAEVERLRADLVHERVERDLDIESGGQAVEQLQMERDRLRAALAQIVDVREYPLVLECERMRAIARDALNAR